MFIDNKTVMPLDEWLKAEIHITKGYAPRPGFHIGEIPDCPWTKSYDGSNVGYYKGRRKGWRRVFAEVEYVADINYNSQLEGNGKKGFDNELPVNGYYTFKEAGVGRVWIIADKMKITHVLSEDEHQQILGKMNYDEIVAYAPYKSAMEKRMGIAI